MRMEDQTPDTIYMKPYSKCGKTPYRGDQCQTPEEAVILLTKEMREVR